MLKAWVGLMLREMPHLWMAKTIRQLKLSLPIVHKNVHSSLACTTRPDIDDVSHVSEEEGLFRLTEGYHDVLVIIH